LCMSSARAELEALDQASNGLPEDHWRVKAAKYGRRT